MKIADYWVIHIASFKGFFHHMCLRFNSVIEMNAGLLPLWVRKSPNAVRHNHRKEQSFSYPVGCFHVFDIIFWTLEIEGKNIFSKFYLYNIFIYKLPIVKYGTKIYASCLYFIVTILWYCNWFVTQVSTYIFRYFIHVFSSFLLRCPQIIHLIFYVKYVYLPYWFLDFRILLIFLVVFPYL